MKKQFVYSITAAVVMFTGSCKSDFLNTKPLNTVPSTATWADGPLSEAFVFGVYSYLGYGGFEEQALAAYTDEAMFTHAGRNINTFTEGSENPSNIAWTSATYEWGSMYKAIRAANIAIENLPISTFPDDDLRDRLLGESYFLRAYYYQQLLRFYGGVPLIETPYLLNDDYTAARNTYEECVNYIVADLDKAAELLEGKAITDGRASALAAMALKARVLLYAASDLHDAATAKAKSATLNSYDANIALIAYTSGDQASRWQAAKTAAKAVLDMSQGYKLNLSEPVTSEEGTMNYLSIAMGGKSAVGDAAASVELIFQRTHTPLYTQEDNWPLGGIHYGINNGPNGYHNWAGNTPIQQLVDDYEMMDGTKFSWDSSESKRPYINRDPRFYATVMFDGSNWKPRPSDVADKDPVNQIQTGYYDNGAGSFINGIDTRESPVENWNGSRTHYYTRKFIDPNPALADNQSNAQVIPWPFIRYTEMVLNYVEACLETGDEGEARTWLNKIRFRAGMPAINDAGQDLVNRYRNERRIELAYEEHRYHDARRWMIPAETVGRGIKEINVTAKLRPGQSPHVPYKHDTLVYEYFYSVEDNTENETRTWNDKMYYRAISRDEMNKNNKLVNNPGF